MHRSHLPEHRVEPAMPAYRPRLAAAAPWLALGTLLAAGALSVLWQGPALSIGTWLIRVTRDGYHAGSLSGLAIAGTAFAALLIVKAATSLFLFAVFLAIEVAMTGRRPRDWRRVWRHAAFWLLLAAFTYFAAPVLNKVMPLSRTPLVAIRHSDLPAWLGQLSSALLLVALTLGYDFFGYWTHRLQHRIPLFWRFHSVHHSVEEMDSLGSFSHPFDGLVERLGPMVFAALIGFQYESVMLLHAYLAIHGSFNHTSARVNLGWLGGWIVDNRYHFLHHTPDEAQSGVNFGGVTTIWDRIFGTYRAPVQGPLPPTGLADFHPTSNFREFLLAKPKPRPIEQRA